MTILEQYRAKAEANGWPSAKKDSPIYCANCGGEDEYLTVETLMSLCFTCHGAYDLGRENQCHTVSLDEAETLAQGADA